jgi:hypothetical protein
MNPHPREKLPGKRSFSKKKQVGGGPESKTPKVKAASQQLFGGDGVELNYERIRR